MNDRKNTMKWQALIGLGALVAFNLPVLADEAPPQPPQVVLPPGVTEEMLAPPPVPKFMLEKPNSKVGQTVPPDELEARKKLRKTTMSSEASGDEPDRKTRVDAQ